MQYIWPVPTIGPLNMAISHVTDGRTNHAPFATQVFGTGVTRAPLHKLNRLQFPTSNFKFLSPGPQTLDNGSGDAVLK